MFSCIATGKHWRTFERAKTSCPSSIDPMKSKCSGKFKDAAARGWRERQEAEERAHPRRGNSDRRRTHGECRNLWRIHQAQVCLPAHRTFPRCLNAQRGQPVGRRLDAPARHNCQGRAVAPQVVVQLLTVRNDPFAPEDVEYLTCKALGISPEYFHSEQFIEDLDEVLTRELWQPENMLAYQLHAPNNAPAPDRDVRKHAL
ncbi:hypothetical protein, variant 1 [Aphanomyces invadans]|uniref:Uncharacterized protein n=1 Tax=Aphanomyces invadans TaxID=157072 RepID=A0A024T8T1_9STRA|nr:hypothetical protein, variant 1 [Aphanomyces invadans]ETV90031.1 hypothetical protein, variant 1 [Aphanomyces invadans]|eukprot:XP_008881336.1 hypothetical protein, variant 1 [Aphanomyces invadans]